MRNLRQYIRKIILLEGMKMPSDLPESVYVLIEDNGDDYFEITINDPSRTWPDDGKIGELMVIKSKLPCDGAWSIVGAYAEGGFGPMMYDIAMEYVGPEGLMCDRSSVSDEAARVWEHYLNNRPDVRAVQLDNHRQPFITPNDESDDCDGYYTLAKHTLNDDSFDANIPDHAEKWKKHWSTKKFVKTSGTPIIDELNYLNILYYN